MSLIFVHPTIVPPLISVPGLRLVKMYEGSFLWQLPESVCPGYLYGFIGKDELKTAAAEQKPVKGLKRSNGCK